MQCTKALLFYPEIVLSSGMLQLRRRRESPPLHAVVLQVFGSLSKSVYFRISAGNGVPGVIVVAIRVQVRGGDTRVVPDSLLQDLYDL
jgi:hypothetical protein